MLNLYILTPLVATLIIIPTFNSYENDGLSCKGEGGPQVEVVVGGASGENAVVFY